MRYSKGLTGLATFPARGTWIEILLKGGDKLAKKDVPRKGNVDRNDVILSQTQREDKTFPARGTWIEMTRREAYTAKMKDVPRKGNVDRNRARSQGLDVRPDVPRKGNVDRNG